MVSVLASKAGHASKKPEARSNALFGDSAGSCGAELSHLSMHRLSYHACVVSALRGDMLPSKLDLRGQL